MNPKALEAYPAMKKHYNALLDAGDGADFSEPVPKAEPSSKKTKGGLAHFKTCYVGRDAFKYLM
jgi:hypothetical protein